MRFRGPVSDLFGCGLVLSILMAGRCGGAESSDESAPLLGCWKNEKDQNIYRFEKERCSCLFGGQLVVGRVRYEKDKLELSFMGAKSSVEYSLKDGRLTLKSPKDDAIYTKLDGIPPEMDLKPMALPASPKLEDGEAAKIQAELSERLTKDQNARMELIKQMQPNAASGEGSAKKPSEEQMRKLGEEMSKLDGENTKYLFDLVQRVGWIDAKRFGAQASNAAFILVQHSMNLPLMMAALPEIEKDMKSKVIAGEAYALLYDRLQMLLGEKQKFGSQISQGPKGEMVVYDLQDPEKVDEYRKELGMGPLADYLKMIQAMYGGTMAKSDGK